MRGGYFRAYRTLFDPDGEWHPEATGEVANRAYAWLDMISMARFEAGNGLERGQLYGSARTFAKRWNWKRTKANDFLGRLADAKAIEVRTRSGRKASVVTICNYDSYQIDGENERTRAGQTADAKRTNSGQEERKKKEKEVSEVVAIYLQAHPSRRVVDGTARRKISARLNDGFGVEDLRKAILGQAKDAWCIDKNKMGLDWSLRDADHVHDYVGKYTQQTQGNGTQELPLLNAPQ